MISCDSGLPHNTRNDVGNSRNVFEVLLAPEKPSHPFSTSQNFWDHLFATWDQVTREVPWDVESETRIEDFNNASSNLLGIKRPAILGILLTELIIKMYDGSAETHYLGIALHPVVVAVDTGVERQTQICNFIFFPSFLHFLLISVFSSLICLLISHLSLHNFLSLLSHLRCLALLSLFSILWLCVMLLMLRFVECASLFLHRRQHRTLLHPCVPSKRPCLVRHWRFDGTHGCVLKVYTGASRANRNRHRHIWTDTHVNRDTSNVEQTHTLLKLWHAMPSLFHVSLCLSLVSLFGSLFLLLLSVCLLSSLTFSVQWQWQRSLV